MTRQHPGKCNFFTLGFHTRCEAIGPLKPYPKDKTSGGMTGKWIQKAGAFGHIGLLASEISWLSRILTAFPPTQTIQNTWTNTTKLTKTTLENKLKMHMYTCFVDQVLCCQRNTLGMPTHLNFAFAYWGGGYILETNLAFDQPIKPIKIK